MEPGDEYLLYDMENRPEAFVLGETCIPYSLDYLREFVQNGSGAKLFSCGQVRLIACLESPAPVLQAGGTPPDTGRQGFTSLASWQCPPAGILDFFNYEALHQRAEIGILVCPDYRNQGLGQKILAQACSYAKNQLNLHQLYASVRSDNPVSLKLFDSAGFERCSHLKDWIRSGARWVDVFGLQKIL